MYVPEGPCLRSLKSYLLHHKERRILEIKKTNLKTKQNKNIKTRAQEKNIDTCDCGTTGRVLFYYYYWLTESCKTKKKKTLKENVFKDIEE